LEANDTQVFLVGSESAPNSKKEKLIVDLLGAIEPYTLSNAKVAVFVTVCRRAKAANRNKTTRESSPFMENLAALVILLLLSSSMF
jgi:hypothetical protein